MKPVLGLVGGFVVSLGMFVGGLAVALFLVAAEPGRQPGPSLDLADLWTEQPRTVNKAAQAFERIPALQIPSDPNPGTEAQVAVTGATPDSASQPRDSTTTASVPTAASGPGQPISSGQLSAAHVEWCANRYQSYRPEDNSYTLFSGGQRPCLSPYLDEFAAAAERVSSGPSDADSYVEFVEAPSSQLLQYASDDGDAGTYVTSDHVMYCFSRYRSYRLSLLSAGRQHVPAARRRPAQAVPLATHRLRTVA